VSEDYVVVMRHLDGPDIPGNRRTRQGALDRFDELLRVSDPGTFGPDSDTSLRVVTVEQAQASAAVRDRQRRAAR
jgi:hypothetical protein